MVSATVYWVVMHYSGTQTDVKIVIAHFYINFSVFILFFASCCVINFKYWGCSHNNKVN
jgi:hypothetical protein